MRRREEWLVGLWCLNRDGVVVLFGMNRLVSKIAPGVRDHQAGPAASHETSTDIADAQLLFLPVYSRDPLQSPTYKSIESQ